MKLKGMEIYGYGKWENLKIARLADFQCFYGQNEAGKSTIMSFIHSILFGFPAKKGNARSFVPKNSRQYGGKLLVTLKDGTEAIIERVKDRIPDEVTVVLSSGRSGGEALLVEIMQGMDQSLYRAVFSFDLFDIQNVQSFSKEDLGNFLFSAAVVGTDGILRAEQYLNKQLEQRFKPTGTKPVLNRGLQDVKKAYEDLKKAEKKNTHYEEQSKKKLELINSQQQLNQEVQQLEERANALRKWLKIEEVYINYQSLLAEDRQLGSVDFPVDGLRQLENHQQRIEVLEEQLNELKAKEHSLEEKLAHAATQQPILQEIADIQAVCEANTIRENDVRLMKELELEIKALNEEFQEITDKLHLQLSEEEVLSFDTSMFQKELITKVMKAKTRLLDKKLQLDEESDSVRNELIDLEKKIDERSRQLLGKEERAHLIEKVATFEKKESKDWQLREVREKISILKEKHKQAVQQEKKTKKIEYVKVSFFFLLFLIIGIWGWQEGTLLIQLVAIGGFCLTFISTFFKQTIRYSATLKDELHYLNKQRTALEETESMMSERDIDNWRQQLERDKQQETQMIEYNHRLEYVSDQHEKMIAAYEEWEREMRTVEQKVDDVAAQFKLTKNYMKNHLLDAFGLIEELKNILRKKATKQAKVDTLYQSTAKIEEQLSSYFKELAIVPRSFTEGVIQLRNVIDLELNRRANEEKTSELKDAVQADIVIIKEKLATRDHHIQSLLQSANVGTISEFKEKGMTAKRKLAIKEELRTEELKLTIINLSENQLNEFFKTRPTEEQLDECLALIKRKKDILSEQEATLYSLTYEINQLEEGGVYADLLHRYQQIKAEWNDAAKEWAVYATAKRLLTETVNAFKEVEFPKILTKAERYFSDLTLGQYRRILYDSEQNQLLLESSEGQFFTPQTLSQATAEQLYISLRFSLAEVVFHRYQIPFIIDDGFVNFDHKRLAEMIRVLRSKQAKQQIIFFSCHERLLDNFQQEEIIDLTALQTATNY